MMYSNDPGNEMDFWHTLPDRPLVDNNEAFHALLLFFDNTDPAQNYKERVELLHQRHMLPKDFNRPANESITRGVLAVALVRALNIKGGLTMHILGPTQRYATRELQYMHLYPASSPQQTFSGADFIGIIGRVEDYQRTQQGAPSEPKPHVEPPMKKLVANQNAATQPTTAE